MQVTARFYRDLPIKVRGIRFAVHSPNGQIHRGDLVLTQTKLIWCPGDTQPKSGHKIKWEDFIKLAEEQST